MKKARQRARAFVALFFAVIFLVFTAVSSTAARASTSHVLVPEAPGTAVESGGGATIDFSNSAEGYLMACYSGSAARAKLQLTGPNGVTYTYNLNTNGHYEVFALTSGSGSYNVVVYELIAASQYAFVQSATVTAELRSAMLPYLYPNQYVNFTTDSTAVAKGAALAEGAANDLAVVENVYNYVTKNIVYDDAKAGSVKSGYLPVVDDILAAGKGICFDYAALMATMLRSQNIPTRLEVGYVSGGTYHAWVSVHLAEQGWVNGIISFDGKSWKLMDPTFASSSGSSKSIQQFIGNGSNYSTKYVY